MKLLFVFIGSILFMSQAALSNTAANPDFKAPSYCFGTDITNQRHAIELKIIDGALTDLENGDTYKVIKGAKGLGTQQEIHGDVIIKRRNVPPKVITFVLETKLENDAMVGELRVNIGAFGMNIQTVFDIICE